MSLSFGNLSSRVRENSTRSRIETTIAKALDEVSQIARRLTIDGDIVMADQRKTFKLIDPVLIVVRNNDFHCP